MSWLGQSEKCSDKYVLAWPVDYESARSKVDFSDIFDFSVDFLEKIHLWGPKFKVKIWV